MANSSFNLSALNGSNGFIINGIAAYDDSGFSVSSAGDINGDGIDDLIIGAPFANPNGVDSGQSYVVFGNKSGFSSSLKLSSLNGSNGFIINGIAAYDFSGFSVSSAGDINGDGIDDLIIGAYRADPNGVASGQSYVVFGNKSGFSSSLNLSSLNGSNGFIINGINSDDLSGYSVSSAGDINGDGIDDLIISALQASPNGEYSGQSYVVFGNKSGFSSSLNLSSLNGSNGFIINGINSDDLSGYSVSSAGDINGDGIDDLIISALQASPNGEYSGQSYVVFGNKSGFSSSLNLSSLNGSNGFIINGIAAFDESGNSVSSAGDINGDGIDDLIIGAPTADRNSSISGRSYVVFGNKSGFSSSLNLSSLNGSNGFIINGINFNDESGNSVSSVGDINGDGIDDLIIGAPNADPNDDYSGQSYVVFGNKSGFSSSLNLSSLNGSNGFIINGINSDDESGNSVSSAGDINGDGIDDLIIGALQASPNGDSSGQSYVVFGNKSGFSSSLNLSALNGSNGFIINGINSDDLSGFSVSSAGDINGDGIDDLIIGAPNADPNADYSGQGQSYVVFGNAAPKLDLNGSNGSGIDFNTSFTGTAVSIVDSDLSLIDSNSPNLVGATVTITNLQDAASEILAATITNTNITANYSNGVLTLAGTATVAQYQQVLKTITYNNTAANPNTTARKITFVVNDGAAHSNTSTVATTTLAFNLNQPPFAKNDIATTNENTVVKIKVLANDADANNDSLTVTKVNGNSVIANTPITLASGALLTLKPNGTFDYNPNAQFESLAMGASASDSFTYTISDGKGGTSTAKVNLTLTGVNDNPVAGSDSLIATQFIPKTIAVGTLLANDSDIDTGDMLKITNVTNTKGGAAVLFNNFTPANPADDSIVFVPTKSGTGSFQYTITDGKGGTTQGNVNLLIGSSQLGGKGKDSLSGNDGPDLLDGSNGNDTLNGGKGKDTLIGGSSNDLLVGGTGADVLTGSNGADTFGYTSFADSLLSGFDRIADLKIGTDFIDGPNAVSAANLRELGAVSALTQAGISTVLTNSSFAANRAVTFSFGSRTFLVLNNSTAGFQSANDAVIEITGFSGSLNNLAII
ncbi:MAG: Ig-like domain-containing protein [Nostoc sp.]